MFRGHTASGRSGLLSGMGVEDRDSLQRNLGGARCGHVAGSRDAPLQRMQPTTTLKYDVEQKSSGRRRNNRGPSEPATREIDPKYLVFGRRRGNDNIREFARGGGGAPTARRRT